MKRCVGGAIIPFSCAIYAAGGIVYLFGILFPSFFFLLYLHVARITSLELRTVRRIQINYTNSTRTYGYRVRDGPADEFGSDVPKCTRLM